MVILTSNGFQSKDNCQELLKIIKNKKVYVCTNAIEREFYKKKHYQLLKENVLDLPARFDGGDLTQENIYKFIDYYDCIYLSDGNLKSLGEMLGRKEIKDSLLKFINKGKTFIAEGISSLIVCESLEYLNDIVKSLDEENEIYKPLNYSSINTLSITKDKIIVMFNKLPKHFQGTCKVFEKQTRTTFTYIKENELIVL